MACEAELAALQAADAAWQAANAVAQAAYADREAALCLYLQCMGGGTPSAQQKELQ